MGTKVNVIYINENAIWGATDDDDDEFDAVVVVVDVLLLFPK